MGRKKFNKKLKTKRNCEKKPSNMYVKEMPIFDHEPYVNFFLQIVDVLELT